MYVVSLENEAASFELQINNKKSMSIVNSSTTRQPRPNAIVLNGGKPVEEVNQLRI